MSNDATVGLDVLSALGNVGKEYADTASAANSSVAPAIPHPVYEKEQEHIGDAAKFVEGVNAAARMSPLGRMVSIMSTDPYQPVPGFSYNPKEHPGYEAYNSRLMMSESPAELEAMKAKIDQENQMKASMGQSGLFGHLAQMGVDVIGDPFMWAMGPMGTGLKAETAIGRAMETVGQVAKNDALNAASGLTRQGLSPSMTDEERDRFIRTCIALNAILGGTLFAGGEAIRAAKLAKSSILSKVRDSSDTAGVGEEVGIGEPKSDVSSGGVLRDPSLESTPASDVLSHIKEIDLASEPASRFGSLSEFLDHMRSRLDGPVAQKLDSILKALPEQVIENLGFRIHDAEGYLAEGGGVGRGYYEGLSGIVGLFTKSADPAMTAAHELGHHLFTFLSKSEQSELSNLFERSGVKGEIARFAEGAADGVTDSASLERAQSSGAYLANKNEFMAREFANYLQRIADGEHVRSSPVANIFNRIVERVKSFIFGTTNDAGKQRVMLNNFFDNVLNKVEGRSLSNPGDIARGAIGSEARSVARKLSDSIMFENERLARKAADVREMEELGRRYQEFSSGQDTAAREAVSERIQSEGLSQREADTGNEQVPTGIGLEKLTSGMTVTQRMGKWASVVAGDLLERLVGTGGSAKIKNLASNWIESAQGVLARKAVTQGPWLAEGLEGLRDAYAKFRGEAEDSRLISAKITFNDLMDRAKGKRPGLSYAEYNKEIGRWADSPMHEIPPEYQPGVKAVRDFLDKYRKAGDESGLWAAAEIEKLEAAKTDLAAAQKLNDVNEVTRLTNAIRNLEKEVSDKMAQGPNIGLTPHYFSFIPDLEAIKNDPNGFIKTLADEFQRVGGGTRLNLEEAAKRTYEKIVRQNVFSSEWERVVFPSHRTTDRVLGQNIDLRALKDYRINDADFIMRRYYRQMGTDLALMQEFGSVSLSAELREVAEDYASMIDAARQANDIPKMKALMEEKDSVLSDFKNAHDAVRGLFGVTQTADSLHTGAMKGATLLKNFAYITMMGGAGLSSILPDLMTPVFKEGMGRFLKMGVKPLLDFEAIRMATTEMHGIGIGLEMLVNGRGPSFVDTAMELPSTSGIYGKLKTGLEYGSGLMSNLNLLNPWTAGAEVFTGTMIGNRIFHMAIDHLNGEKLADVDIMKLARAGINEDMLGKIASGFLEHGTVRFDKQTAHMGQFATDAERLAAIAKIKKDGGLLLGNLNNWKNIELSEAVKMAIYSDTINTILRPQVAGNIPTLMSHPAGQVLLQFQSFAMGSTQSILLEGLQRKDAAFWNGVAALTAAGYLTAQIKAGVAGTDWDKKSWQNKLVESIDRANLLGYATNINNIMDRLSDHRISLQRALGEPEPAFHGNAPFSSKIGSILGPGAQQMARAGSVATDAVTGNFNRQSAYNLMAITPLMTVPFLQVPRHEFVDSFSQRKQAPKPGMFTRAASAVESIPQTVSGAVQGAGGLINQGLAQAWQ